MIKILVLILLITSSCTFSLYAMKPWTAEEDAELIVQRNLSSKNWKDIAIAGRTKKQCYTRYTVHLDPAIDRTPLSQTELFVLVNAVKEHKMSWGMIAGTYFKSDTKRRTIEQLKSTYNHLKKSNTLANYFEVSPNTVARISPQHAPVETKKRKKPTLSSGARKAQKAFFPEPATVTDGSLRTEPVSQIVVVSGADCLDPNALLDTAQSNFVAPISQQLGNSQDSFIYPLGYFDGDDSLHTIPSSPSGMSQQNTFSSSSPVREISINYHLLSSPFYNGLFTQPTEEHVDEIDHVQAGVLSNQRFIFLPPFLEELATSRLTVEVDQSYFPTLSSPQRGISQESHWSEFSGLVDISSPLSPVAREFSMSRLMNSPLSPVRREASLSRLMASPYLIEYL